MKQWQAVTAATWFILAAASAAIAASGSDAGSAQGAGSSGEQRAAGSWTTNDDGMALIEKSEGLRLQAYNDGATWRIGYGHSGDVTKEQAVTAAQAESLLRTDIRDCEVALGHLVTVPVTQNEFSALVSLCYSTGAYSLRKATVIARLNAGDRPAAANGFMLWVKASGKPSPLLVTRRTAERALFLK